MIAEYKYYKFNYEYKTDSTTLYKVISLYRHTQFKMTQSSGLNKGWFNEVSLH